MKTEGQVMALFAKANPVSSLDLLDPVEALDMEHLAHLSARSSEMTEVKTDEMKPEGPGRGPRLALAVAMGVIVVAALGLLLNNESELAAPSTTESGPYHHDRDAADSPRRLASGRHLHGDTVRRGPDDLYGTVSDWLCRPGWGRLHWHYGHSSGWLVVDHRNNLEVSKRTPRRAGLSFNLGGWLFSDPCRNDEAIPDVPVGLTVDDFANALADHLLLEVTTPIDVTLDGYSGKYLDLQVPSDISKCEVYRPWEPGLFAQGPGHRWHLWILDVEGVRVVVESADYEGTTEEVQAELEAMVDSIEIER